MPGSPSFGDIARQVVTALQNAPADLPAPASSGVARWQRSRPALVLQLAHQLGRATLLEPDLLRPRLRAFLVGWELEELTTTMREELDTADVLLGISEFNSAVYRRHFPDTPVVTVPVCPDFPPRPAPDRPRWGIPDDCVAFLNVFNPVSGFDRKNPIDALTTFQQAFEGRADVRLVFKTHGGFDKNPEEGELTGEEERASQFLELCRTDDRIVLVDTFMSYADLTSLIASCDVYVSMSRAEGLGLPVLEAMALGVSTMCVPYAGHTDFTGDDCNVLVPFDLVDVPESASHYFHPSQYTTPPRWAQPRLADATKLMRELADNPAHRRRTAERGAAAARAYQARCEASGWMEDLADAIASPSVMARHAAREAAYQRVARSDRQMWLDHEARVRRARRLLQVRTFLGRCKGAATDRLRGY